MCHINVVFTHVSLEHKSLGIFVEIANNALYESKLYIFILCQKSLGYDNHVSCKFPTINISKRNY